MTLLILLGYVIVGFVVALIAAVYMAKEGSLENSDQELIVLMLLFWPAVLLLGAFACLAWVVLKLGGAIARLL